MKYLSIVAILLGMFVNDAFGQSNFSDSEYKIVFQLTTKDTMAHKALMKQIGNITSVAPKTKIEVICHGPGLSMLLAEKSIVADKIEKFSAQGVVFDACEFSMKERKVTKEELLNVTSYVQAGILHLIQRQEEGFYYVKAGF